MGTKAARGLGRKETLTLIERCWKYRADWHAANEPDGECIAIDDLGIVLGISEEEAKDLCEIGMLKANEDGRFGWEVRISDLVGWLEAYGARWFAARTERAIRDLCEGMGRAKRRQKMRDFGSALLALHDNVRGNVRT